MIKKKIKKKDNIIDFPTKLSSIEKEIEGVVFAAAEPLDIETIENKISKKTDVKKILLKLQSEYSNRGINLVCISKKWSFRTSPNLSNLMTQEKTVEKKLSRAAIETLAIIVYHQPVTRAEIEEIRGVAFGTNTLEILMELNWVKPGGRKNVPGKPIQYITTDDFLSHFNLQKLSDLPTVDELGAAGLIDSTNIDNAIFGTGKFYKEKQDEKKEDIYSNIDEMLNSTLDSIIEILSEPGVDKNFILNLKCTSLPSLEWGIPSIDTEAIPKSYKICIKPTTLSESNYSQLANAEGKPGIYIIYSKPENGVSVNATPVRRIFCRPKPFCKL